MKDFLRINLSVDNILFAVCNDIAMEPYAMSTARKFTFRNLKIKRDVNLEGRKRVNVRVFHKTKERTKGQIIYDFNILLLEAPENIDKMWWIYGLVYDDYEDEYEQGVIDVYRIWQKGELFDWSKLPLNSELKRNYISACLGYSGLSTKILDRDRFQIDVHQIKEDRDFLYYIAEELIGDKGYFGHSLHTFKDCLLELYHHKVDLKGKEIIFLNSSSFYNSEVMELLKEVKKEMMLYDFTIREESNNI